ncbi:uncharacterized protein si:dkey-187a12.4 [Trichomycterus rosablanca]|uniref:uncharacterized protein si:dkey-187a12.4 n=1 Tax=Trichomycterus rosablanca TaxID=2290929 RepID=UPI002F352950
MDAKNSSGSNRCMERRVEGLVNKHMADMALQTLQQRLSAVSEGMNHSSENMSRSEDLPNHGEDPHRRTGANFHTSPLPEFYKTELVAEKLMSGTLLPPSLSETAAQRKIISLLLEIKEEQQRQWVVLKDLQARIQGHMSEEDVETLDMDLPLLTLEQLDEAERHLEDAEAQKRMVSHLSQMGGATVDDAVRRLMQAVLSFAVGSELNWVGRGQKRSFRNTRLQGVLFRALKKTPVGKEATLHQFADVVKKWLRFAPFRQGGSGRRHHYKTPVELMCPKYQTNTEG